MQLLCCIQLLQLQHSKRSSNTPAIQTHVFNYFHTIQDNICANKKQQWIKEVQKKHENGSLCLNTMCSAVHTPCTYIIIDLKWVWKEMNQEEWIESKFQVYHCIVNTRSSNRRWSGRALESGAVRWTTMPCHWGSLRLARETKKPESFSYFFRGNVWSLHKTKWTNLLEFTINFHHFLVPIFHENT